MTAKILRDKFEQDLKDLQNICSHIEAEWMPYMWAPGHFGGNVLVCRCCEKILEDGVDFLNQLKEKEKSNGGRKEK